MLIHEPFYDAAAGTKLLSEKWGKLIKDPNYFGLRKSEGTGQEYYVLEG